MPPRPSPTPRRPRGAEQGLPHLPRQGAAGSGRQSFDQAVPQSTHGRLPGEARRAVLYLLPRGAPSRSRGPARSPSRWTFASPATRRASRTCARPAEPCGPRLRHLRVVGMPQLPRQSGAVRGLPVKHAHAEWLALSPAHALAARQRSRAPDPEAALGRDDAAAPTAALGSAATVDDWAGSGHAAAGVNCAACHAPGAPGNASLSGIEPHWTDHPGTAACEDCHPAAGEDLRARPARYAPASPDRKAP